MDTSNIDYQDLYRGSDFDFLKQKSKNTANSFNDWLNPVDSEDDGIDSVSSADFIRNNWIGILIGIIVLVILGIVGYYYLKKRWKHGSGNVIPQQYETLDQVDELFERQEKERSSKFMPNPSARSPSRSRRRKSQSINQIKRKKLINKIRSYKQSLVNYLNFKYEKILEWADLVYYADDEELGNMLSHSRSSFRSSRAGSSNVSDEHWKTFDDIASQSRLNSMSRNSSYRIDGDEDQDTCTGSERNHVGGNPFTKKSRYSKTINNKAPTKKSAYKKYVQSHSNKKARIAKELYRLAHDMSISKPMIKGSGSKNDMNNYETLEIIEDEVSDLYL